MIEVDELVALYRRSHECSWADAYFANAMYRHYGVNSAAGRLWDRYTPVAGSKLENQIKALGGRVPALPEAELPGRPPPDAAPLAHEMRRHGMGNQLRRREPLSAEAFETALRFAEERVAVLARAAALMPDLRKLDPLRKQLRTWQRLRDIVRQDAEALGIVVSEVEIALAAEGQP